MSVKAITIEDQDLFQGEIRRKGIIVSTLSGVITIGSAKFRVYKTDNIPVTEEADATILNNGTAAVTVYSLITAGTESGGRYVEYKYVIGSETRKARLGYSVI